MKFLLLILLSGFIISANAQSAIKLSGDTLKVLNKEFAIHNASGGIKGYLMNIGAGQTTFMEAGKDVQFTVGAPEAPLPGDSIYSSNYCINKSIKVWRNGLLQYATVNGGVRIDSSVGRITFSPPLALHERICIESLNGF
jgi:hypothetical protein